MLLSVCLCGACLSSAGSHLLALPACRSALPRVLPGGGSGPEAAAERRCCLPALLPDTWLGEGGVGQGGTGGGGGGGHRLWGLIRLWELMEPLQECDLRLLTCEADSSRSQQRASDTKGPRQASVVPWVPSLGGWQRGSGPPVSPCEGMADRAWEHLYPPPPPNKLGSESLCVSRGLAPRRGSPELRCCACPPISELSLPCPLLQGSRGKARDPAPSRAITGEPCCPLIAAPRWWSQQSQG